MTLLAINVLGKATSKGTRNDPPQSFNPLEKYLKDGKKNKCNNDVYDNKIIVHLINYKIVKRHGK